MVFMANKSTPDYLFEMANSVFGALGPVRTRESNLKPWAMSSWSRQLTSI